MLRPPRKALRKDCADSDINISRKKNILSVDLFSLPRYSHLCSDHGINELKLQDHFLFVQRPHVKHTEWYDCGWSEDVSDLNYSLHNTCCDLPHLTSSSSSVTQTGLLLWRLFALLEKPAVPITALQPGLRVGPSSFCVTAGKLGQKNAKKCGRDWQSCTGCLSIQFERK